MSDVGIPGQGRAGEKGCLGPLGLGLTLTLFP